MNAYIYATNARLYPLNDAPPDLLVGNRRLAELQDAALRACGLTPLHVAGGETPPPPLTDPMASADPHLSGQGNEVCRLGIAETTPYMLFPDNLYLTPEGLRAFLVAVAQHDALAPHAPTTLQAYAAPGPFADRLLWHLPPNENGGKPLPLWRIVPNHPAATPVSLKLDEVALDVRMPPHMGVGEGKGLETLLTRRPIIPIETWPNLWQANMQALFAITREAQCLPWWKGLFVAIAGRGNLFRMMAKLNHIGRNCRIHPTAVVELSHIGDDVEIGAYAVVRNCIVGDGALIDDHASVRASVIGPGASVANNNNVLMCVVYPRAFIISGPYQFSVFGADTAIMHCICCDTRLDGYSIKAEVGPGKQIDTTQRYLGTCYGHRVRAGAGTITAPGRAIPNDLFFLPPTDAVVAAVDADLPIRKNLVTEGGRLVYKGKRTSVSAPDSASPG